MVYYDSTMKLRIYTNTKLDIKETSKVYAQEYASQLINKLSKGVDKLDHFIVNH